MGANSFSILKIFKKFLSLRDPRRPPRASGIEGFQRSQLRLRSLQKNKREHEHASADEQEHNIEFMRKFMRKEGRTIIKNQAKNAPRKGPEGPKSGPGGLRGASKLNPSIAAAPCELNPSKSGAP